MILDQFKAKLVTAKKQQSPGRLHYSVCLFSVHQVVMSYNTTCGDAFLSFATIVNLTLCFITPEFVEILKDL